jgi:DNA mismatch repair protein MutS
VQDASEATGIVDRAVTRVLTPGTLVDETLLDEGLPNHVAALTTGPDGQQALALVELSTGTFAVSELPAAHVVDELVRAGASELLYPQPDDGAVPPLVEEARRALGCALTARPAWTFRTHDAKRCLCEHFGVTTLAGFGLDDTEPCVGCAGAVLQYLEETQSPDGEPGRLAHLDPPRREASEAFVAIDAPVR